jgi:hypothetical protein
MSLNENKNENKNENVNKNENKNENKNNIFIDGVKKTASTVYEGLGTIGKTYNILKFIVILFIFTIVIIFGFMYIKSYNNKIKITGRFSDISCNSRKTVDNKIEYFCNGHVIYNIDNKEYIRTYSVPYTIHNNQEVVVYYNPSNVDDFIIGNNKYYIGIAMIVIACLIIVSTLFWMIVSLKYDQVAAFSGASVVYNMINNRTSRTPRIRILGQPQFRIKL